MKYRSFEMRSNKITDAEDKLIHNNSSNDMIDAKEELVRAISTTNFLMPKTCSGDCTSNRMNLLIPKTYHDILTLSVLDVDVS